MAEPTAVKEVVESKIERIEKDGRANNGGARAGAGMPAGKVTKRKLEQLTIQRAVNKRIMANADKLINAQLSLATGEQVLMVRLTSRDSKGRVTKVSHEVVNDIELIKQYLDHEEGTEGESLNDNNHFYYLTTRPANNQAIDSLLNRALGKAPDKLEVTGGFFSKNELTIKVIDSKHDIIDIGEDGQIIADNEGASEEEPGRGPETSAGIEPETGPGTQAS